VARRCLRQFNDIAKADAGARRKADEGARPRARPALMR